MLEPHAEIHVANGGYVVRAWVRSEVEGEYEWTTSVFSSLASTIAYTERVLGDLEGPGQKPDLQALRGD